MNLVAAILMLGATGSAERSVESTDSIAGIVAQCGKGAFNDFRNNATAGGFDVRGAAAALEKADPRLSIDGQPRDGLRAWGEAALRVGGYVAEVQDDGSVGLAYRLRVRHYDIATSTAVSDGRVVKRVDAWWTEVVPVGRSTRRIPIHVRFTITANETGAVGVRGTKTVFVGRATGTADTSDFRCGFVRRIAERQAASTLDTGLRNALATIEREGRLAYASGSDIADVLDGIKLGIEIGGRMRR